MYCREFSSDSWTLYDCCGPDHCERRCHKLWWGPSNDVCDILLPQHQLSSGTWCNSGVHAEVRLESVTRKLFFLAEKRCIYAIHRLIDQIDKLFINCFSFSFMVSSLKHTKHLLSDRSIVSKHCALLASVGRQLLLAHWNCLFLFNWLQYSNLSDNLKNDSYMSILCCNYHYLSDLWQCSYWQQMCYINFSVEN